MSGSWQNRGKGNAVRLHSTWRPLQVVLGSALASALIVVAVAARPLQPDRAAAAAPCPDGFRVVDMAEVIVEQSMGGGEDGAVKPIDQMLKPICLNNKQPETFSEISTMQGQRAAAATGGLGTTPPGAMRRALAQRDALAAAAPDVPGADGTWTPLGDTPLLSNVEEYPSTSGTGLNELNGRIDSLDFDPEDERLFASIGTGGVWMSEDYGDSWESIGDSLPTQTIGAIAWSPAQGGTIVAVSGEPLMGGNTYTGLGAYYTRDLGETWQESEGIPDGLMGFQVAVDPAEPNIVYAATSQGLFRSEDAGETFVNVNLPTSEDCAGVVGYGNKCQFANFVTDVVVKQPGGTTEEPGRVVVAAVGYRAGTAQYPNGELHSPGNGLYRSPSGEPGTFENLNVSDNGFTAQQNIGRVELGNAVGDEQDHNYLYAIVQDAELFNGGVPSIDIPEEPGGDDQALSNTSFNGIYVSPDFGSTWTQMADTAEVALNPTTHSGLAIVGQALLFAPGVQAWYNMWIKPDPTQQNENGVPTELTFGLEEVWKNRCVNPQNTAQQNVACDAADLEPFEDNPDVELGDFEVVGPYFADQTCLLLDLGKQCVTAEGFTNVDDTTHPDQHDALYIPNDDGGSKFVVGNDGGAYVQDVPEGELPDDRAWGQGNNRGFNTLLPYSAEVSKDGTVWYGLQDNGSGKITPDGRQIMAFGGDGLYVAVDPDNSDYAWSETPNASMRVTTDGGRTWRYASPGVSSPQFSNPLVMDPTDSDHLLTAGNEVVETVYGPDTAQYDPSETECLENCWEEVFNLGTNEENGATNRMSAVELQGDAAYVGFCGVCDVLNSWQTGFQNGLATNVGGDQPPERMTSQGWHFAKAEGLPNRMITSIAVEPDDTETIYVTLGGYANREWVPPGSYLDENEGLEGGNVYMSTDAGETFTNISGSLPDTSAFWVEVHGDQLLVGTDIGVFLSGPLDGDVTAAAVDTPQWVPLNDGLPAVPISTIRNHPGDGRTVVVATYGRGVYSYTGLPDIGPQNPDPDPDPDPDDDGDGGGGGVGDLDDDRGLDDDPVLPATGGGLALVGVLSMTLGALVAILPGRRRRRR